MKSVSKLLALMAVLSLIGVAQAADKPAKKPAGLKGEVVKVDGTNLVIKAGTKGEVKEVTVATDDKTEVTVDGAAGKLADLKPGMKVGVTPETGTATKVVAATPKPKPKAK